MSELQQSVRALLDVLRDRRMRFLADDAPVIAAAVAKVEAAMPPQTKEQQANNG